MTFVHRIGDALVGDRLRTSIDRRVRRQLAAALPGEVDQQVRRVIAEELASSRGAELIEAAVAVEVKRQLAAVGPDPATVNRHATLGLLLGEGSRVNRLVDPRRLKSLSAELTELTGVSDVRYAIRQAYAGLLDAEATGLGRIAGSTYNIVGKLVAPPLLGPPEGPVLEIGTLYGLFSPLLLRQLRRAGRQPSLTVLDPLAGVQIQSDKPVTDDPTGTPVSPATLRANLATAGLIEGEQVRVLQGYSTDPAVQQQAADQRYAVIIVDGDHSAEGVTADLWWVQDLLRPGGIVVMDDYGDPLWPGVQQAVDGYLRDGGRLTLLGTAASSAYLRG